MEVDVLIGGGSRYDVRMGKYFGLVVVGALLLTGCASGEPESPEPTAEASETAEARVQARSLEVSDATPEPEPSAAVDEEARYLRGVKPTWRTELPSDEDLLAVAEIACEQLRTGTQTYELDIITGGTPEDNAWHSSQVGVAAVSTFCPDADPQL